MDFQDNNTMFQSQNNTPATNSFAKASRILGFVAIAFGLGAVLMPYFALISIMSGMLSIAFGFVSKNQTGKMQNAAITGIVCSFVTLGFILVVAIFFIAFMNTAGGQELMKEAIKMYNDTMEAYNEFYGY